MALMARPLPPIDFENTRTSALVKVIPRRVAGAIARGVLLVAELHTPDLYSMVVDLASSTGDDAFAADFLCRFSDQSADLSIAIG
jgi:hypothetical protein